MTKIICVDCKWYKEQGIAEAKCHQPLSEVGYNPVNGVTVFRKCRENRDLQGICYGGKLFEEKPKTVKLYWLKGLDFWNWPAPR